MLTSKLNNNSHCTLKCDQINHILVILLFSKCCALLCNLTSHSRIGYCKHTTHGLDIYIYIHLSHTNQRSVFFILHFNHIPTHTRPMFITTISTNKNKTHLLIMFKLTLRHASANQPTQFHTHTHNSSLFN